MTKQDRLDSVFSAIGCTDHRYDVDLISGFCEILLLVWAERILYIFDVTVFLYSVCYAMQQIGHKPEVKLWYVPYPRTNYERGLSIHVCQPLCRQIESL